MSSTLGVAPALHGVTPVSYLGAKELVEAGLGEEAELGDVDIDFKILFAHVHCGRLSNEDGLAVVPLQQARHAELGEIFRQYPDKTCIGHHPYWLSMPPTSSSNLNIPQKN